MPKFLKRFAVALALVIAGTGAYFATNYARYNPETSDLTDAVRHRAPGDFIRLTDGLTHYQLEGPENGRTVVLVHGFSVPYFLWDQTFDPLVQAGFRVLRYDLYGRGLSDRPDLRYDAGLFDRQLLDLLAALKISGPIDLVGASMGGAIVVTFAARYPEKVRTISLFDPAYLAGDPLPWQLRTPLLGEYINRLQIAPTLVAVQQEDFLHPEHYPGYFIRYQQQMQYRGFLWALLSTARHYLTRDGRQEFQSVGESHKPVLLVWGKADKDVPFEVSQAVLRAIPQAEFHPIGDAAHVPYYEHPEIVNPLLISFMNKN
ncbi:MAG: alpha/beta hydrolase [Acidobacteriia bacterium]|nr:alpha/beta hydrolase [Terriglobia bacterium]